MQVYASVCRVICHLYITLLLISTADNHWCYRTMVRVYLLIVNQLHTDFVLAYLGGGFKYVGRCRLTTFRSADNKRIKCVELKKFSVLSSLVSW